MRHRVTRVERQRVVEGAHRLVDAIQDQERHAEVVPAADVLRIGGDRRAEALDGFGGPALVHAHAALAHVAGDPIGARGDDPRVSLLGSGEVAAIVQHAGLEQQERRLLAAGGDCARDTRLRFAQPPRLVLGERLQVPHIGKIGIGGEHLVVGRDGAREIAARMVRPGFLDALLAHGVVTPSGARATPRPSSQRWGSCTTP